MNCGYASTMGRAAAACVLSGVLLAALAYWRAESVAKSQPQPLLLASEPAATSSRPAQQAPASRARSVPQRAAALPNASRPPRPMAPTTQPVPSEAEQTRARKLIREVFNADYRQTDAAHRQTLAAKLLQQAIDTPNDPAARFVLLCEARDLATSAGEAQQAARAIQLLAQYFAVDEIPMLTSALATAANAARSPEARRGIIQVALASVDRAVGRDDYAAAARLLTTAASAAARSRDETLAAQVRDRNRDVQAMAAEYERFKTAQDALQTRADPQCSLTVGRYRCFLKGDFENGLPLLAGGSDRTLQEAARAELSKPGDSSGLLKVANLWWEIADAHSGLARKNLRAHAASFYRQSISGLSGFELTLARKRLEQLEAEQMQEQGLRPGLYAELFRGIDFAHPVRTRVDTQIDFDWGEAAPDESLPKDNFSFRWTGTLRAMVGGRYDLVAIANTGARVIIDEQLVIDAPNLSRQRNGLRRTVDLSAGLHAIRVEYWDTSGIAKMKLLWKPPSSRQDEPIPASSFYHEPNSHEPNSAAPSPSSAD